MTDQHAHDPNSGAVPQPGGIFYDPHAEPVIVADDDLAFDAAVADETTEKQEKPARKKAAKKVAAPAEDQ